MQIYNNEVIDEIHKWNARFTNEQTNIYIYEIAFFKIFVKFELYISKLFVEYSIGKETSEGLIINRKLNFRDEKHIKAIIKDENSSFVNYINKIDKISKYIFEDGQDPFGLIFSSYNYSGYIYEMRYIRNYIAHESEEAKNKYIKSVLHDKEFIEPANYLSTMTKKGGKTHYSKYIEKIEEMVEILQKPSTYLEHNKIDSKGIDESPSNLKIHKEVAIDTVN